MVEADYKKKVKDLHGRLMEVLALMYETIGKDIFKEMPSELET